MVLTPRSTQGTPRQNRFTTLTEGNLKEQENMHVHSMAKIYEETPCELPRTYEVEILPSFTHFKGCLSMLVMRFAGRRKVPDDEVEENGHAVRGFATSKDYEDTQLIKRIEPKSTIGPVVSAERPNDENLYGLDVSVPGTGDPGKHVWVTASLGLQQLNKQKGFIGPAEHESEKVPSTFTSNIWEIPGQAGGNSERRKFFETFADTSTTMASGSLLSTLEKEREIIVVNKRTHILRHGQNRHEPDGGSLGANCKS